MSDIDWLAVNMVCEGKTLKLTANEKRAVVRQMRHRLLESFETSWGTTKITVTELAERLQTSPRHVERLKAEITGYQAKCPVCLNPMWVDSGSVLPHPDSMMTECPMSGRQTLSGLAAIRPDLYEWVLA